MDQLNEFIAAQHQTNLHLTESMTRVETLLAENSRRLFGGDGHLHATRSKTPRAPRITGKLTTTSGGCCVTTKEKDRAVHFTKRCLR